MWLFDTCSIINLSYCPPVAALFVARYGDRGGWVRAVQVELTSQRARRPPHPQAGRGRELGFDLARHADRNRRRGGHARGGERQDRHCGWGWEKRPRPSWRG